MQNEMRKLIDEKLGNASEAQIRVVFSFARQLLRERQWPMDRDSARELLEEMIEQADARELRCLCLFACRTVG